MGEGKFEDLLILKTFSIQLKQPLGIGELTCMYSWLLYVHTCIYVGIVNIIHELKQNLPVFAQSYCVLPVNVCWEMSPAAYSVPYVNTLATIGRFL